MQSDNGEKIINMPLSDLFYLYSFKIITSTSLFCIY